MFRIFDKGVHEPELKGLNILSLKIGVVQLAHDAAPTCFGLCQLTLLC